MNSLEGRRLREPDSVSSLADTYLLHALDEFRSAGSAEMLYREQPPWYSGDSILGPIQQRADALFARLRHLRATVLFAALAAEGFANEFLASHLSGRALAAADRLPTTDKLIMGPTLAGLEPPIAYGREPGQSLTALFRARNDLVHPLVRKGTFPDIFESEDHRPYEPKNAAKFVIHVAHAQVLLHPLRGDATVKGTAGRVWEERAVIEAHATAIGADVMTIPDIDSPSVRDLMAQMIESAARRHRRNRLDREREESGARDEE
jgi:hypothetical protein